ncbi:MULTISPECIES: helix-turn-helix domain-containing protein [unclassified Sphingomonas]|jgi:cytoskeleton protein RodZ|uniref:helix-turn-helix domain-containing protein n=1 Tax=unclassified Sphingomonas TaxID=196159 RepID=UPI000E102AB8|nr:MULTISPECIES: helix-turn-helix domain-containing protein [unclassified Sphingomonas]AXJ94869.1 helix-turn-helix domain-containing protein [Sphingomonas sp. FARSPH]
MDEVDRGQPDANPVPPATAGGRLRAARESRGLSLAEVAGRTRVPQRHLEALETGSYGQLPSPTYAMGFSKAYARAVGLDEVSVAQDVRRELDRLGPRQPEYVPYETADPARVPSRGVAIVGAGVALAVLILVALWYGTSLFQGGHTTSPSSAPVASQAVTPATAPTPTPTPAAVQGGQVRLTANGEVWLRVYDADGRKLFQNTMKPGDTYDVPADAKQPMINVGRPDKLAVTLNGSAVPPLGDGSRPIKDVRIDGAAMAARLAGQPLPGASPTPAASSSPVASRGAGERRSASARPRRDASSALSEVQRANLQAADAPPAAAAPTTNGATP